MVQQTMARSKSPTTRKQHQREEKSYNIDDSIEGSYQSRRHRKGNTSSLTSPTSTTDNYNVNPALYGWHATINARNNRDTPTNKKFNHAMKYQRRRSSFNSTRDLRAAIAKANQSSVVNTNYAEAVARRTANRRHHKRQSIERSASFDEVTKRESELMDESSTTKIFKAMFGSSKTKGCDACEDLEKDVSNRSTTERVKAMFNMSFSRNDDDEEDAYDYTRRRHSDDSEDSMDESFSTTKQRIWNMFKSDNNNNAGQESDSYLQMSSSARSATKGAGKKLKKLFIGKRDSEIEDLGNDVLLSYGICKGFSYTD